MVKNYRHSRIWAGAETAYDQLHARVPDDLISALLEAGISNWDIRRSGQDLFHTVDAEDLGRAMEYLNNHPANHAWQSAVGGYVEVFHDDPMVPVWSLAAQRSGRRDAGAAEGEACHG